MIEEYIIPKWFIGYNIFMELFFALVTLSIALYAFKIFKLTCKVHCDKQIKLFGTAFLLMSLAYLSFAILNLHIVLELTGGMVTIGTLRFVEIIHLIANLLYIILFTSGMVTLAYMTFRLNSSRLYVLIIVLSFLAIFLSYNKLMAFNILTNIILLFVALYYLDHYLGNRNSKTLIVFLGFGLLFIGNILFNISIGNSIYYAFGHILVLIAYSLLLTNLVMAVKK